MKKLLLSILYLFITQFLVAQLAIIQTENKKTTLVKTINERGSTTVFDSIPHNDLVLIRHKSIGYFLVEFYQKKNNLNQVGYVNSLDVKELAEINSINTLSNNQIHLTNGRFDIIASSKKFCQSCHTYQYEYPFGKNKILNKIDGEPYIYGTKGILPQTEFSKITIKTQKGNINLPKEALKNIYNPKLTNLKLLLGNKPDEYYLLYTNDLKQNNYSAAWHFINNKYQGRKLFRDDLFNETN